MDNNELIRLRAYEIWVREGQPEGRELEHWLQARRDILGTRAEQRDENLPPQAGQDEPKKDAKTLKESTELG